MKMRTVTSAAALGAAALVTGVLLTGSEEAKASSHKEAPFIGKMPKVDGTDFYMFRSYEAGKEDTVTFIANYLPLQDPYGGPNFFNLDDQALYEIHVDNDGDAHEDLTFQFRFQRHFKNIKLPVGTGTAAVDVSIPLINAGTIGPTPNSLASVNVNETYTVNLVRGDRRTGTVTAITNAATSTTVFKKPVDDIGAKTFSEAGGYDAYANLHIYPITIPGCTTQGRVFVGQRHDPFYVNLGEIFDLINLTPGEVTGATGANDVGTCNGQNRDILTDKNVTSISLEIPIACLTANAQPIIGGWTTASVRQARVINPNPTFDFTSKEGGAWAQVSRLGHPLVNEVVIGLQDKDKFNTSHPSNDGQFATYVTNPTFPKLVNILFGAAVGADIEPKVFPRTDLIAIFLTGVPTLNQPTGVVGSEELRLNTGIAVAAAPNQLGVLGGDVAGFPNGRRVYDDVVDITVRAAMGALIAASGDIAHAPVGNVPFSDCARRPINQYLNRFPYAASPIPGSPFMGP